MVVDSVVVWVLTAGVEAALTAPVASVDLLTFCPVSDLGGGLGIDGVTTSVFCSHAPRSTALAKMQINFFIEWRVLTSSEV